ncbi:MAG: hypothetical protein ACPG8A_00590 [Psychrobium sp.]
MSIKAVERLCRLQSEEILIEQGLVVDKWTSEFFNGERTFNVDGRWKTNGGVFLVECEVPFGGAPETMTLEITKEKALE